MEDSVLNIRHKMVVVKAEMHHRMGNGESVQNQDLTKPENDVCGDAVEGIDPGIRAILSFDLCEASLIVRVRRHQSPNNLSAWAPTNGLGERLTNLQHFRAVFASTPPPVVCWRSWGSILTLTTQSPRAHPGDDNIVLLEPLCCKTMAVQEDVVDVVQLHTVDVDRSPRHELDTMVLWTARVDKKIAKVDKHDADVRVANKEHPFIRQTLEEARRVESPQTAV